MPPVIFFGFAPGVATAIAVFSDSCGAAIIARSQGEVGIDIEVR